MHLKKTKFALRIRDLSKVAEAHKDNFNCKTNVFFFCGGFNFKIDMDKEVVVNMLLGNSEAKLKRLEAK